VDELVEQFTMPALERLIGVGDTEGLRPVTVRDGVRAIVGAAAELQQTGEEPTDAALHAHGAPKPDSVRRLLERANLENLPAAQTCGAIDAGIVPLPERIVVEAHTDRTKGPDKFGSIHVHPPFGIGADGRRRGVPHVTGGIASAMSLGEADGTILPFGVIPLAQGYFHADAYPANERDAAIAEIRRRAGFHETFLRDPEDVTRELLRRLVTAERLAEWERGRLRPVVCGGRMRLGFPVTEELGAGNEERYLGCHLAALCASRGAGFVPFFELPTNVRGDRSNRIRRERCPCSFRMAGAEVPLDAVIEAMYDPQSAWTLVDREQVMALAPGFHVRVLRTRASAGSTALDVTLVAAYDFRGALDVFVTTLPASAEHHLRALVMLAIAERRRRGPGSTMDEGVRDLLVNGHVQLQQRRRHPERRSFAAVAQTAFGVLQLARRAA
jgi:hypothetical protein